MASIPPKRRPILKIVLISVAGIAALLILFTIGSLILSPVFDNFDKARFEKLDSQSRALYEQLNAVSGGSETWKYDTNCNDLNESTEGFHPYALFKCEVIISTEVFVTSATQFLGLQDKYYSSVDESNMLRQTTELDKQRPADFGVNFVVSSAEKHYQGSNSREIGCVYIAKLTQSDGSVGQEYGTRIAGGTGISKISLNCSDKARGKWYE